MQFESTPDRTTSALCRDGDRLRPWGQRIREYRRRIQANRTIIGDPTRRWPNRAPALFIVVRLYRVVVNVGSHLTMCRGLNLQDERILFRINGLSLGESIARAFSGPPIGIGQKKKNERLPVKTRVTTRAKPLVYDLFVSVMLRVTFAVIPGKIVSVSKITCSSRNASSALYSAYYGRAYTMACQRCRGGVKGAANFRKFHRTYVRTAHATDLHP